MSKQLKRMYAEIAKTEAQDDGTLKVWGWASSGAVDSDGETITPDAMKAALPDYMKFGAVREMHQPKAAGTAIEAEVQDDGRTWFGAHVVDPVAVKKVEAGVYKGFSVGGKVTSRDTLNKTVIKGINLIEVSLVDRPANPEAVFTMFKAERTPEDDVNDLAELLDAGTVTPGELLAMAKAAREPKAEPVAPSAAPVEPKPADEVKKGLYSVQDFASVLGTLGWICRDAQDESAYEGDNSPVPAQMRAWLATGIGIFRAMAEEETSELLASLRTAAGEVEVIQLAREVADLQKAGAKFSAATKTALKGAHDAMKTACDHMDKLGYDADADKGAASEDLTKLTGELDTLKASMATLTAERDELAKAAAEAETLRKRVTELEAKPAPGKALLKAIGKGDDLGPIAAATNAAKSAKEELPAGASQEEITKAAIKDVYRGIAPKN